MTRTFLEIALLPTPQLIVKYFFLSEHIFLLTFTKAKKMSWLHKTKCKMGWWLFVVIFCKLESGSQVLKPFLKCVLGKMPPRWALLSQILWFILGSSLSPWETEPHLCSICCKRDKGGESVVMYLVFHLFGQQTFYCIVKPLLIQLTDIEKSI